MVVANHHKLLDTREGVGEEEPVNTVAGCAGQRRHSLSELYSTAAGASMPQSGIQRTCSSVQAVYSIQVNGTESFLLPVKIHSGSRKIRENVRSESEGKIGPSGVVRAGCAGIR